MYRCGNKITVFSFLIMGIVSLSGCIGGVSTPAVFHTLHFDPASLNTIKQSDAVSVAVGVGPVVLPDMLKLASGISISLAARSQAELPGKS